MFAPGVGDNSRGLVVVLGVLRALQHAGIETDADLLFIGNVGEEGLEAAGRHRAALVHRERARALCVEDVVSRGTTHVIFEPEDFPVGDAFG